MSNSSSKSSSSDNKLDDSKNEDKSKQSNDNDNLPLGMKSLSRSYRKLVQQLVDVAYNGVAVWANGEYLAAWKCFRPDQEDAFRVATAQNRIISFPIRKDGKSPPLTNDRYLDGHWTFKGLDTQEDVIFGDTKTHVSPKKLVDVSICTRELNNAKLDSFFTTDTVVQGCEDREYFVYISKVEADVVVIKM